MIKVYDIAYVTYQVTDLDRTEKFLTDFGLHRADRRGNTLYMRAVDTQPYVYVAVQGDKPGLMNFGLKVRSEDDLLGAAELPGASAIEPIAAPGGGQRVRLVNPDGYTIDFVYGIAVVAPLPSRAPFAANFASKAERPNREVRIGKGPSDISRISHVALYVKDADAAVKWFTETLGFIVSDYVDGPEGAGLFAAFTRTDKGSELCDHHVVALIANEKGTIHHTSFWVEDFDALHNGADWLAAQGYTHEHGIGRHGAGSQVFSYWRDADGILLERFTDGDVFDNTVPSQRVPASMDAVFQWGPAPKPSFFE